jgi:hypothetical protein
MSAHDLIVVKYGGSLLAKARGGALVGTGG